MVVEDDWIIANHIVSTLRTAGARIAGPVPTAHDALDELKGRAVPDAATLDIRLLDGDSLPVARRLAELNIPFLFLSASTEDGLAAEMRARPCLGKPFAPSQLVLAVEALLRAEPAS